MAAGALAARACAISRRNVAASSLRQQLTSSNRASVLLPPLPKTGMGLMTYMAGNAGLAERSKRILLTLRQCLVPCNYPKPGVVVC